MCGIIGFFSHADSSWLPGEAHQRSVAALAHRGPDGEGVLAEPGVMLGHRRLSVLDLTDAGRQPMESLDGRFVITYNGEIYNFIELRQQLEKAGAHFRSRSDTEVLLNAWAAWGEQTLDRLDGIFAFAVLDRKNRVLTLVRDHFGIKPLFYRDHNGILGFASEPLALFHAGDPEPQADDHDLDAYFTFNYTALTRTGLRGVRQLPPGHLLRIDSQGPALRRYWALSYSPRPAAMSTDLVEAFADHVRKATRSQMVSDAPLGLFLSGGLDSYTVAQAVADSASPLSGFTLGFAQAAFDETPAAREHAAHLGIALNATVFSFQEEHIRETLGSLRELLADASCFPYHQLSLFARKSATVILAGDGGDELLAGYDTYKAAAPVALLRALPAPVRRGLWHLASRLPSDNRRYGWRMVGQRLLAAAEKGRGQDHASFRRIFSDENKMRLYDPDFFRSVRDYDPIDEYARLMGEVPSERSWLTARQHADLVFHLPSILAKVDRMSMATGLEVRVPLLRRELVEFCLNLPDQAKLFMGKGKRIMRRHLAGKMPPGALSRPKAGFLPPVDGWFRSHDPMRSVFSEALGWAKGNLGFLRWNEVAALWDEHRRGETDAGFVLLGILQFINFNRHCRAIRNQMDSRSRVA